MQSGTLVVVWIADQAARLFLGLQRSQDEVSRWAIIGTVDREQVGVGIWLAIARLEGRRGNAVTKVWTVRPAVCLTRWEFIITAQLLDRETGETKVEGFQPLEEGVTKAAYDTDFYAWTQAQAEALRAKDWPALDIAHLAEEIDSLGKSDRRALVSHLDRLLLHLLKWRYDPAQEPRRGWQLTIRHARREMAELLAENRSLHGYPAERLADAYRHARGDAVIETDLPLATFPEVCPWSIEQVLEADFWPEEDPHA